MVRAAIPFPFVLYPPRRQCCFRRKEYESALRSPDLLTLTDINDRLKKLISEKEELKQAYNAFMAGPVPDQATEQPPVIARTDKNRFLWDGELTDWVLAFNASGKAPHVARNIRGDIVFDGQQADACVLHSASGKIEVAQVEDILRDYKVDTVRLSPSPCAGTTLQSQDVLIAMRGELLKQPPSCLAPLLGLVEDGTFEELKTLTSDEFEKFKKFCELNVGVVIGHELTHGFDDEGRHYDAHGNLQDWWTKKDAEAFEARASGFIDEYGAFVAVKDSSDRTKDIHVDGKLTLGENTADNGGIRLSYNAFLTASGAAAGAKDSSATRPLSASSSATRRVGA